MSALNSTFYSQSVRTLPEGCLDIWPALTHNVRRAGDDEMKTTDEDQRLLERRRKLERLKEKSNFEVGPIAWKRDELYQDRTPPGFKHSDPDSSGKN
jgi:hypothetical protein